MYALLLLPFLLFQSEPDLIVCNELTRIRQHVGYGVGHGDDRAGFTAFGYANFLPYDGPGGSAGEHLAPGTCSYVGARLGADNTYRLTLHLRGFSITTEDGKTELETPTLWLRSRTMLWVSNSSNGFFVKRMMTLVERQSYEGQNLVPTYETTLYECEYKCILDRRCAGFNFKKQRAAGGLKKVVVGECTLLQTRGNTQHYRLESGDWGGTIVPDILPY